MKRVFNILVITLILAELLFSCTSSQSTQPGKNSFKAGAYMATANGHNGPLTVETTFSDTAILDVKIVSQMETPGVQQVINIVPQAIVAQQSLAVDTVTGASFCGRAVIAAVTDCVIQAGGDVELLNRKLEKQPARDQSYEADVVIIGAGGAGLAAAVSAHQNGASVIVLEKLGLVGGSTIFSGGAYNAADPEQEAQIRMTANNRAAVQELLNKQPYDGFEADLQKNVSEQFAAHQASGATGLFDSPEWHMLQTYNGGDYEGIPELIQVLCQNSLDNYRWMASLGAGWSETLGAATGSLWQRSHYGTNDFPEGAHSVIPYKNYIDNNNGVDIHFDTRATDLITRNGRVVGVKAVRNGAVMTYTARKGLVMATGGFGANIEMRQQYNILWDNLDSNIGSSGQRPAAQGDGIIMGQAVGAQLEDMGLIQLHPSGELGTGLMNGDPRTSGLNRIFVNNEGNRFVAEDARRDDMIRAIYRQPGSFMWVVADATRYDPDKDPMKREVEMGKTLQGATIEELAQKMGADPANLQKAFDDYNAGVDGAPDPLGLRTYGRKMGNPPFYAAKRAPTVHHTMGGLRIDAQARVLGVDNRPIPGFYAAGEVTGGVHGANRLGGNALADISVYGKIAGQNAAQSN
ncbi:MAG: FAD-dependent oxidoreductase [Spirochaetaceae bacterium]|nr:FAD-dependent oxidoreductase [Spirochaetaceae bacterium]